METRVHLELRDARITRHATIAGTHVDLAKVRSVYYRRPVSPQLDDIQDRPLAAWMLNEWRRAWGGVLHGLAGARWVNHPTAIGDAIYKPEQLVRASGYGLRVPPTLLTTDPVAAARFCAEHDWNVIAKPVGHGDVRGPDPGQDRLLYTTHVSREHASTLDRVRNCPTLFQRLVDKVIDIRATVVGEECIAIGLHSQDRSRSRIDCRRDDMVGMRYSRWELPSDLARALVRLTTSYGLHFGAIDLALDRDGIYWFFELNPAGQWAWLEQEAGAPISEALYRVLA